MPHQQDRFKLGVFPLPGEEQTVAVDDFSLKLAMNSREGIGQESVELLEPIGARFRR